MKKLRVIVSQVTIFVSLISFLFGFAQLPFAFAQSTSNQTIQIAPQNSTNPNLIKTPSVSQVINFLIAAAIVISILLALLFLIWGGIQWITSGGDKAKVDSARSHLVSAIIGLIIVVLAVAILNFILQLLGLGSIFQTFTLPTLQSTP